MAQYPQGVTTFIPDYQAYQPDFNFTANVLQLKQTQYDQNWNRLNNIYGQLLNAPLTHDESISRRDNTLKRINFDLQRITGLDLSLEQNVQQATQLFRPLYEDQNLMKDMVFTKNASFEKSLGEGKRISTDKDVHSQYWNDGIRAIDLKVQEFKETPYDQISSFGDVKYTPYVNVEMKAMELATKMDYKIKRTTPQGDWLVTEKNGDVLIPTLQSVFYSAIGNDPDVRAMYATRAYLERKDNIMANKDKPEFGGNAELAEKKYLNGALSMLQKQTETTKTSLSSEQKTNQNMIDKLEKSIANGTDIETTKTTLEKYKEANTQIEEMLKQNESDRMLITDNINKTMTTTGGSTLATDDINELRGRVDAVMASTFLQGDLNKAAEDFSKLDYELSYDPNPFAVQRQKYLYDSSLIGQRAAAQKDVALFKYQLDMEKLSIQEKLSSGIYQKNEKTGEVEIIPELGEVQAIADMMAKTGQTDPEKINKTINGMYKNDAESAKTKILNVLDALNKEGLVSNTELLGILKDEGFANGYNMTPLMSWLKANGKKPKGTKMDSKTRDMIINEGTYTTQLEKEMSLDGSAGGNEAQSLLRSAAVGSLDDIGPESITRMTKRMMSLIDKKKDIKAIRENSDVQDLVSLGHTLDDYSAFRKVYQESKKRIATEIKNKLTADGYEYAEFLFGDGYEMVATPEEFEANIRSSKPDDIVNNNGMSWGGFMNTVMGGATAGGVAGGLMGLGIGAIPGFIGGAASGAAGYLATGLIESAWNAFSGDSPTTRELKNASSSAFGSEYNIAEEYQSMLDTYDDYVQNSLLTSPIVGLHHKPSSSGELGYWDNFKNSGLGQWLGYQEQGTGLYTANGAGITIEPGVRSPTYDHFLEVKKALEGVYLDDVSGKNGYVSFSGINKRLDEVGDVTANKEIFNAIYNDMIPRVSKKGEGLGRFRVGLSPLAGEDVGNGAIVFKLPEEYLKKFEPDSNGEKLKGLTKEVYQDMLANGISVITDASKLQGISIYRNSYKTAEQIRIESAGGDGVTYEDPRFPGYNVNFKTNRLAPSTLTVTQTFAQYDPNTKKMIQMENVENLSNMGTNIKDFRNRYFNEFAIQHQALQNNTRRQYGQ
jgi:hypothetical protein